MRYLRGYLGRMRFYSSSGGGPWNPWFTTLNHGMTPWVARRTRDGRDVSVSIIPSASIDFIIIIMPLWSLLISTH